MESSSNVLAGATQRGWASRWLGRRRPARVGACEGRTAPAAGAGPSPDGEAIGRFVGDLIAGGRPAFALLGSAREFVTESDAAPAWEALRREAALVPFGRLGVVRGDGTQEVVQVPAFCLDRRAVTNRDYARFVAAGGYDSLELWPSDVWPSLMRFTDRDGRPGPRYWSGETYPTGKADHPVVGLCWHEATAYARWVGKRLPTAAEWQKAAGWPEQLGGALRRYPWGDLFDPGKANLHQSGRGDTAPVDDFPGGETLNGIRQMTGNVWEWLDDRLDAIPCRGGEAFSSWKPMRRIVGGAFDTYILGESACHFITGQPELDRRRNVGFRCALPADRLRPAPCPA